MVRWLISTAIRLGGNVIGLLVAAIVLDDLSIDAGSFLVAVLIFTGVEVLVEPALREQAMRRSSALAGATALAATFIGLLVTDIFSDGLSIEGVWTWVFATGIVWLAALLAVWILGLIFVKRRVEERRDRR